MHGCTNISPMHIWHRRNEKLAEHHNLRALEINPKFQFALHIRSLMLSKQKRFDEIEKRLLKAIEADDQNPVTIMSLGIVYWRAGKTEESYKLLAELLDRRNFEYIKSGILTRFYMAIGEKEKSFKWLRQSRDEKDIDFVNLFYWPLYDWSVRMTQSSSKFIRMPEFTNTC